ncbi:hypothetical protein PHLGIDRAFT_345372 [Phlebiopsis gigantea 11061_1 CR5-6]|uniref:Uncharacterized protein n=1 Tax=Phlebiopsis gigantea (strain 11061_1 CR5-6) TaxID=745531 RepID=A0A0C3RZ16_PHLG1|nr:hypothetical protein PHLGIDRAFT_345372 [Phlebiopsis gigantea 11061_1 CR5-6]
MLSRRSSSVAVGVIAAPGPKLKAIARPLSATARSAQPELRHSCDEALADTARKALQFNQIPKAARRSLHSCGRTSFERPPGTSAPPRSPAGAVTEGDPLVSRGHKDNIFSR